MNGKCCFSSTRSGLFGRRDVYRVILHFHVYRRVKGCAKSLSLSLSLPVVRIVGDLLSVRDVDCRRQRNHVYFQSLTIVDGG